MIEIEGILTKDILKEVYYEGGIFPNLKKRNYFCLFLIVIMLCLTPMLKEYKTFGYILLFLGGMSIIFVNLLACYAKKKSFSVSWNRYQLLYKKNQIPYKITFEDNQFTLIIDYSKKCFNYEDVLEYKKLKNQIIILLKNKMFVMVVIDPNSEEAKNLLIFLQNKKIPNKS